VLTETRRGIRSRGAVVAAAVLVCLAVTACGSNLDPAEVARTEGRTSTDQAAAEGGGGGVDPGTPATPESGGAAPLPGDVPQAGGPAAPDGGDVPPEGAPPAEVPEENAPVGDGPQGSCDGFRNGPGITDATITIANASDITGPVPGLFLAARQGTQAFVEYYNATEKLCGRSLRVLDLDSKADAGADQQAYAQACEGSFAAVGSVSSFDAGGAATAEGCGLPDIRAFTVTPQRQACSTCFSAYSVSSGRIADAQPRYWLETQPEASKHVGIFYTDVEAAKTNAESFGRGFERAGMNVDLVQGIGVSEFNYTPYVAAMQREGIQFVMFFGPYQFAIKLQQAMKQQGFTPKVYLEDPTIYDANYVSQANGAGDGSYVYSVVNLFDADIPEMKLYRAYLEQVAPGAVPNYYGLFAWSATRLFVERATALGGGLSRETLVGSMRKVKGWTGNGVHAPMSVGSGETSPCVKILQLDGSTWRQVSSGDFMCGSLIST
jgi:ABC-type branched-subunit amino acid transport system substrate-binding protein